MGKIQHTVQMASDNSSEGLTNIKIVEQQLERITDLLTETKISPSSSSVPPTPALSREVSDISAVSSQDTTSSSVTSSPSVSRSVSQNPRPADIISEHPLLQFKEAQVRLIAGMLLPV
jgi:hypothetical protein